LEYDADMDSILISIMFTIFLCIDLEKKSSVWRLFLSEARKDIIY